jgi:hypothetical protein
VKFYCNLHNIRKASLFPRDPVRLTPWTNSLTSKLTNLQYTHIIQSC